MSPPTDQVNVGESSIAKFETLLGPKVPHALHATALWASFCMPLHEHMASSGQMTT